MSADERVRGAAVRLFAAKGFHGVGIRELADAAGLSSASLYHYMGTKQDLLDEIMATSLDRLITAAERVAAEHPDPVSALAALVRMHVGAHALRPDETIVVDNELRALTAQRRAAVLAKRDAYEDTWRRVIADGCAAGVFVVAHPGVARIALLEMCTGVAGWYDAGGALSLVEIADAHAAMALALLGCSEPAPPDTDTLAIVLAIWAPPTG